MSKISELSDGGSLVSSDYLIAVRSGGNVKVRMDSINVDQVDLGDNEFIRLGNSQDLTMVHTSTQSIINQAGIGDLLLQKAGATKLTINASGIDVTGSVTADGLVTQATANTYPAGAAIIKSLAGDISYITNVGGDFLISNSSSSDQFVLSSAGSVGIGTASLNAANKLEVTGDINTTWASGASRFIGMRYGDGSLYEMGLIAKETPELQVYAKHASGAPITFLTGATPSERMRIDASGNVQIVNSTNPTLTITDTTNPTSLVLTAGNLSTTIGTTTDHPLTFDTNDTERMRITSAGYVEMASASQVRLTLGSQGTAGTNDSNWIRANGTSLGYNSASGDHAWEVGGSPRMTLKAAGDLLIGDTSVIRASSQTGVSVEAAGRIYMSRGTGTGGFTHVAFYNGNELYGSITGSGSTMNYYTSSDQRLKENIADADDAGSKVDSIQVRKFDWKTDGSHQDYGMVAQELLEVAPEAVSAPEDSEEMMGVDYSKLVPMMLKEIQSLRARVAQLES